MPERKCDCCGETKKLKGGKICEKNSHFICSDCIHKDSGIIFLNEKTRCPFDDSKLR